MKWPYMVFLLLVLALTGACTGANKEPNLRQFKHTGDGPDEFSILPGEPLQPPESYTNLPLPTPDGVNLADKNPKADGIAALSSPAAQGASSTSADGALVAYASRHGITPDIRQILAKEDRKTRRQHGRVNVLAIGIDDYTSAYKAQWLDAYAELERWRQAGVKTPAAPPKPNE